MLKDLTGQVFGRLTAISRGASRNGYSYWLCTCTCGVSKEIPQKTLLRTKNATRSCGCYMVENRYRNRTTHGATKGRAYTKLYSTWRGMIQRCADPNQPKYKYYGGKGVKVCREWQDFAVFKDWVLSTLDGDNLTIDRIDSNGDYCPENCRWVNRTVQANNTSRNAYLTAFGETLPFMDMCRKYNSNPDRVRDRVFKLGWSHEPALTAPAYTKRGRAHDDK